MDNFQITVKNTFVHLCMPSEPPNSTRRSSSVPGSLRFSTTMDSTAPAKSNVGAGTSRWSDVSTIADSCSEVESVGSSPKCSTDSSSVDLRGTAIVIDAGPLRRSQRRSTRSRKLEDQISVSSNTKLCRSGEAPRAEKGAVPQVGDLMRQLALVVAAAASALGGCSFVKSAKTTEGPRGWSIVAQIKAEDAKFKEEALANSKEALLKAARDSGIVHVLGHRAQPFVSTPVGFAASLGAVADESKTCWSMINQGFCRRGCACRWEHPTCQTNVNVMVQVQRA